MGIFVVVVMVYSLNRIPAIALPFFLRYHRVVYSSIFLCFKIITPVQTPRAWLYLGWFGEIFVFVSPFIHSFIPRYTVPWLEQVSGSILIEFVPLYPFQTEPNYGSKRRHMKKKENPASFYICLTCFPSPEFGCL